MMSTTGLILAGGAGRRVEGRDKGLIEWRGRPLVTHVAASLAPQVDQLLISCNRNFDQYSALGAVTIADSRRDFQGPLAGIEAALPHIKGDYLAISACDTPELPQDLVQRLLQALLAAADEHCDIAFAHDGEHEQYLCAILHTSCLESLPAYLDSGQRSVRQWYRRHRYLSVDFSDEAACFRNLNYKADM